MDDAEEAPALVRPTIVIDGANLAYGVSDRDLPLLTGIEVARSYFSNKGHDCVVVLSRPFLGRLTSAEQDTVRGWCKTGGAVIAAPGENDDLFMLATARQLPGAYILTNDLCRDHVSKWSEVFGDDDGRALAAFLSERRIGYAFRGDTDLVPSLVASQKAYNARVPRTSQRTPSGTSGNGGARGVPPTAPIPPAFITSGAAAAAAPVTSRHMPAVTMLPPLAAQVASRFGAGSAGAGQAAGNAVVAALEACWRAAFAAGAALTRGERTTEPLGLADFDFLAGSKISQAVAEAAVGEVLLDVAAEAQGAALLQALLPAAKPSAGTADAPMELWTPHRIAVLAQVLRNPATATPLPAPTAPASGGAGGRSSGRTQGDMVD